MTPGEQEPRRWAEGSEDTAPRDGGADLVARSLPMPEGDDLAQERIWRAVAKTLPQRASVRRQRWIAVAVACSLAAAGVVTVARFASGNAAPTAQFELTAGNVLLAAPGASWTGAEAGAPVAAASRVKTDARARALLKLPRAAVLVSPSTDAALESLEGTTFLRLSSGELVAEVEPRRPGEEFVIQTTRYRVTVKGTIFAVRERSPDDVSVSVSRGRVEVTGDGHAWSVPAGSAWRSGAPDDIGRDDIGAPERSLLESAADPGPRSAIRVEGGAELEVSEGGVTLGPTPVTWSAPLGQYHFVGKASGGSVEGDATASAGKPTTVKLTLGALAVDKPAPPIDEAPTLAPEPVADRAAPVREHHSSKRHGWHQAASAPSPAPSRLTTREDDAPAPLLSAPSSAATGGRVPASVPESSSAASTPDTRALRIARERDDSGASSSASPSTPEIPRNEPNPPQQLAYLDRSTVAQRVTPPSPTAPIEAAPASFTFAEAVRLSRNGQYQDAAKAFETIASSRDSHAGLALCELGRLQQNHLGLPDAALATYQRYEQQFPRGEMSQEVRLSAVELELQKKDYAAALDQIDGFLQRFPTSERASEVHLLRGNVRREQGNCRAALEDYRGVRAAAQADDALYFTAWCQQNLGQRDQAESSFRRYLSQFPRGRHTAEAHSALEGP